MAKTFIKLTDVNVDGCGTDVEIILEVSTDALTNGENERINDAIKTYKAETPEWDTDGCVEAAVEQLKKEGHEVSYCIPSAEICF